MAKLKLKEFILIISAAGFLFWSCDFGLLGGADITDTYIPGSAVFEERLNFLCGVWYSHYAGMGRLDGYRILKWSELTNSDKTKITNLFPALNVNDLKTYSNNYTPQDNDFILLYDDTVFGQTENNDEAQESWGFSYLGLVRAINIFNGNKNRGSVIIEYFKGADPDWLSNPDGFAYQNLTPGEKPFFGVYYRILDANSVQISNAVNLAAMYAGEFYYTEQKTFDEAVKHNSVENEAEFISWGVVIPFTREN